MSTDDFIDADIQGRDRQLLEAFYEGRMANPCGGTAHEMNVRGLRAVLALAAADRPAAAAPAPAEGEVAELVEWLEETGHVVVDGEERERFFRAVTLLQQQATELAALRAGVVPLTAAQLELLKDILDMAEDEGPVGEGWASRQLQKLRGSVSTWQAAPQAGEVV